MNRTRNIFFLGVVVLGGGLTASAVDPTPAENRITFEANVTPAHVALGGTPTELCVQNVNRRTFSGQRIIADDTFVFRVDPGCGGFFAATSGCPVEPDSK